MIHTILYVEIDIFAALVLLIITRRGSFSSLSTEQKMFRLVTVTVIFTLLFDAGAWAFDGAATPGAWIMLVFTEYAYWANSIFVCYFLLLYCWVFIYGELSRKWAILFAIPIIPAILVLFLNPLTGWVFVFDAAKVYARGPFFLCASGVSFFHLAAAFVIASLAVKRTSEPENRPYKMLMLFILVTLFGSLLQLCIYGLVTIWVSVTLSLLMCYVYLQNSNLAMDPLTHLNNRRRYDEYTTKLQTETDPNAEICLMILDIDYFKSINDTYGHAEGDQALIRAAAMLKKAIAGEHGFLGRIGGDEFAIILPNTNEDLTEEIRLRINCITENENKATDKPYAINLSIGCASSYGKDLDFRTLFREADEQMYECKKARKIKEGAL